MYLIKNFALLLSVLLLTNCATVQSVLKDKSMYMNEHVRVDKLEKETLSIIASQPKVEHNFRKIIANYDAVTIDLKGKEDRSRKRIYTIENMGGGYSRFDMEDLSNDVKFHEKFQLTYGGLILPLITHGFYMRDTDVSGINPIVVTKLDYQFGGVAEKKQYSIEYYGNVIGKYKLDCKSETFYSASEINKSIPGLAIDVKCDTYINKIKTNTEVYVFLKDFNLTLFKSKKSQDGEFLINMTSFTSE